MVLETVT